MRISRYLAPTLREDPADADTISAKLMVRSGMIRKVAAGIYEWLPLGLRVLRKVEGIIREEMDRIGGREVWLPAVQPKELWEETGRWDVYGKELLRFQDRKEASFCLAPTAEEMITDLARREIRSWRQLPLMLYQFGIKFRDEIRPRFGVLRAREFYMKDAYSFHADEEDARRYYEIVRQAYQRTFERMGLATVAVEAETGAIGGSHSHEFMVPAETGEEEIAVCGCGYAANAERAECAGPEKMDLPPAPPLKEVPTPGIYTVEDVARFLHASPDTFLKTMFCVADGEPVVALLRGDHMLSEGKLRRALGCRHLRWAEDSEYEKIAGCSVGFAGPVGLKGKVRTIADLMVKTVAAGVSGANKKDFHLMNIRIGRDYEPDSFADLRRAGPGDRCGRCGRPFSWKRGIEVGHTFLLGTKYSEAMKATYLDEKGRNRLLWMGCYGIGVSRCVAAAIEASHDDKGPIWPETIAPFRADLLSLEEDPEVLGTCEKLERDLEARGVEVLWDDRPIRAGPKFADADLRGSPWRIIISKRTLAKGQAELRRRSSSAGGPSLVPLAEVPARLGGAVDTGGKRG